MAMMAVCVPVTVAAVSAWAIPRPAQAQPLAELVSPASPVSSVATGFGGAVTSTDAGATRLGLDVLRRGGTAIDAAVAAAAVLGVTEPFSSGLGGGGFLLYFDAATHTVHTIDGRESAPASMREDTLVNPATALPYEFQEARVSGISVGVPGTPMTWQTALRRWGTMSLGEALRPAIGLARRGFIVDREFHDQVAANQDAFGLFESTRVLYLPGGRPPAVGSIFRNSDLAVTYTILGDRGIDAFYAGPIARDIVRTTQRPPVAAEPQGTWAYPVRPGTMDLSDLVEYDVRFPSPTRTDYRGIDVYGMSTPSGGGPTVGEALNILDNVDLSALTSVQRSHRYLEASALAFADRSRYIADGTISTLVEELLSEEFARDRACLIDPTRALDKPVGPGVLDGSSSECVTASASAPQREGQSTTNLTLADRWGNVVEYTLTIEQLGGNAMVVPGRGFLLNNELTDFNAVPTQGAAADPNLPGPGKRPRSSMAPTILLRGGEPFLALGSPGGSTIVTTVLQILVNRIDASMPLPEAISVPRASQCNTVTVAAEPAFISSPIAAELAALGHIFASTPEIGDATAIEFLPDGALLAAAELKRRGGGAAGVLTVVAVGGPA